ncbi:MAG: RluA family pseudouridine synthase [Anaerolineaceae bacterium]|nr:RluA family pseudouridine synthase [Anaerolineaceae bacterium]
MSETIRTFTVSGGQAGRLDKYLVECLPDLSRARIQNLIKDEKVTVVGKITTKTGHDVEPGDEVRIVIPPLQSSELIPEDIPLDIVFQNSDLVIINKPAGMVVHPAAGHYSGTLVHAALAAIPDLQGIGGEERPGIVHRLDKETSGLIVMAKNEKAHRWLQEQFKLRTVKKVYLALVDGKPPTPTGRIEAEIARDPSHRKKMAVVSDGRGRTAVTEYQTLEQFEEFTLIEAHPLTGRTHQIRLHLAFLGCPIVGDTIYGHKKSSVELDRHFLHAARLSLLFPGEKELHTFEAPLPPELQEVLEEVRTK